MSKVDELAPLIEALYTEGHDYIAHKLRALGASYDQAVNDGNANHAHWCSCKIGSILATMRAPRPGI